VASCDESNGPSVAPELTNKVVSGRLEGVSTNGAWVWGDGVNQLCQEWSIPGFFYGTRGSSSADVQVLAYPDILEFNDAESLEYISDSVYARPGETIVFRGRNGFFGAWRIEDITSDGLLYGAWYFRSGGGGDFTADLVKVDLPAQKANTDCSNIS